MTENNYSMTFKKMEIEMANENWDNEKLSDAGLLISVETIKEGAEGQVT